MQLRTLARLQPCPLMPYLQKLRLGQQMIPGLLDRGILSSCASEMNLLFELFLVVVQCSVPHLGWRILAPHCISRPLRLPAMTSPDAQSVALSCIMGHYIHKHGVISA